MIKTIEILNEIRRLAKEYPNARYHKPEGTHFCSYTRGNVSCGPDKEGCIVGQAITNLDSDMFSYLDGNNSMARTLMESFDYDPRSTSVICEVQSLQDMGISWGDALKQAENKSG